MLSKTDNYKYICRDGKQPDEHALGIYQHLLFQFEELDLSRLQAKRDIAIQILDLISDVSESMMTYEEIKYCNTVLRALVLDPTCIDTLTLLKLLKEPEQKVKLSLISAEIKRFKSTKQDDLQHISIFDRAAKVSRALNGLPINVKEVSIVQFLALEKEARNTQEYGRR